MNLIDSIIDSLIATNSVRVVDDSLKRNALAASGAGLVVRVSRTYDGVGLSGNRACRWCLARCGKDMTISEANAKGVFQRHDGCGCIIEYTSQKGEKTYQTGKSGPNKWLSEEEFQKRISHGLDEHIVSARERLINAAIEMQAYDKKSRTLVDAIIENHEALKYYTPKEMKQRFERAGYSILPLGNRSKHIANVAFEDGGGYRLFFGGDGYIQYHPKGGLHKISYWKINNGERGVHKYDLQGREVFF